MKVAASTVEGGVRRSWSPQPMVRAEVAAQRGGVVVFADPSLLSPLHGESPLSVFLRCVFFSPLLYAVESLATCDELNKLGAELILADLEA